MVQWSATAPTIRELDFPGQENDFPGHKTLLPGPENRCNCLVNEGLCEKSGCPARFARFNAHLITYGRRMGKTDKLFCSILGNLENSPAFQGWVDVVELNSPVRDERKFLPSQTGLASFANRKPSHKWLGYFQQGLYARGQRETILPFPSRVLKVLSDYRAHLLPLVL